MSTSVRAFLFTATIAALLLLAASRPADACLNDTDSDTLAREARRFPDLVQVITGRFERNPPLYYQMRLRRVASEIAAHPEKLNLYDDAAVACDRLSRDDEAIAWIEKKHARLAGTSPFDATVHEDWYRYYANVGTFRVHRWLRAGADPKRLTEVKQAREEIAQAIRIKPDAHFGREKYQLLAMDWLITVKGWHTTETNTPPTLWEYLWQKDSNDKAAIQGLSGLIVLGNAWESADIFETLAAILYGQRNNKVALLAELRYAELFKSGHKPLVQTSSELSTRLNQQAPTSISWDIAPEAIHDGPAIWAIFRRLRADAEAWQTARWKYMMTRLRAGDHPDIDPDFWKDWHETPAPSLGPLEDHNPVALNAFPQASGCVAILILAIALTTRVRQRRHLLPDTPTSGCGTNRASG